MCSKRVIKIEDSKTMLDVCGVNNNNLRKLEHISGVCVSATSDEIIVDGDNAESVEGVFCHLMKLSSSNVIIDDQVVNAIYSEMESGSTVEQFDVALQSSIHMSKVRKSFHPRTVAQGHFMKMLESKDVVFSYGPAGTGKTFLSVCYAASQILEKKIERIILTRPIVEAGENLGYLPGDFTQKINPYLTPLFDALNRMLTQEVFLKLTAKGKIEVAPLAYMRGRTFENSIVILDEAQNTTVGQMKMFLTRLGEGSKLIINGDVTQIDLPRRVESGLVHALKVLDSVSEVGIMEFVEKDVVRHPVVKKILGAYKRYEEQ